MCRSVFLLISLLFALFSGGVAGQDGESGSSDEPLRFDPDAVPYRTPLSGEGFRTAIFGRDVTVPRRDRRFVFAWDLGAATTIPGADESEVLPFASLYLWHHPDEDTLLRGIIVGVFNEILYAKSPECFGPFEIVMTFDNLTVPFDQGELIDGERVDAEELTWGYVRPGFGFGYREQMPPGEQDNMFSVSLTAEPGYVYFDDGSDTASNFVVPQDTFEGRLHLQMRWDAFVRNLLELPHRGFAAGADLIHGYRSNWKDWGIDGGESASEDQDFTVLTGYLIGVSGVPCVDSDRHRLVGSLHGGVGGDVDRFSSPRVGGGPSPLGEEYGANFRPVLPGATIEEFFPSHYAVLTGEYRYEPIFFTYLGARASLAYLDRDRRRGGGMRRQDDLLGSVGARVTTGFLGETRLQLDYNYNWSVIRQREYGGHEVVMHVSAEF